mgnify:CR=1 FL=1|tara:strand:- start:13 stop:789 length:777 start_codon:yes stop_codon:yes gene_type:complete
MHQSLNQIKSIVIVGSGNVATNLGLTLFNKGYLIKQIWSRNLVNAETLAKKLNCTATNNLKEITNADLYIATIKDDILRSVLDKLDVNNIVHTSGSLGLEVFSRKHKNSGVFYPLQTFNKKIHIDFSNVPILIEANNELFEKKIQAIGNQISKNVIPMKSTQRKKLHLAAVFACNFTNHMFAIANNILTKSNIDFQLLLPLINQTVLKIKNKNPEEVQTGPAIRNDKKMIKNHIKNIHDKKIKDIYRLISESIMKKNE